MASDEDVYAAFSTDDGLLQVGAVFDGCGGTGAQRMEKFNGRKSAWIGSRLAAYCFCEYIRYHTKDEWSPALIAQGYHDYIAGHMRTLSDALHEESIIVSPMIQEFPTTIAANLLRQKQVGLSCTTLWAGDSRCYMLNPDYGLMQLTVDDISTNQYDAYQNLIADGIMNNVINNGKSFHINSKPYLIDRPCLFLAATDGCFAYYPSPMHFEEMLLDTLSQSETPEEWRKRMEAALVDLPAGDDFTMTISICGFKSFHEVRNAFARRLRQMQAQYILPYETQGNWAAGWARYRENYNYYVEKIRNKREGGQQN